MNNIKQQILQLDFSILPELDDIALRQIRKRSLFDDENLCYAFFLIFDHITMANDKSFADVLEYFSALNRRLKFIYYHEEGNERKAKLQYFLRDSRDEMILLVSRYFKLTKTENSFNEGTGFDDMTIGD